MSASDPLLRRKRRLLQQQIELWKMLPYPNPSNQKAVMVRKMAKLLGCSTRSSLLFLALQKY